MVDDVTTVTREALYDQVWAMPMTKLAKEYGVSDVALRKACRKANIPLPVQGHWNKLEHGKKTAPRPVLPLPNPLPKPGWPNSVTVTRSPPVIPISTSSLAVAACIQSLAAGDARLQVATDMRNLHPAVWPKRGTSNEADASDAGTLPIKVEKQHRRRAVLLLDALAKALETQGYPVTAAGATIEGQLVPMSIGERTDKVLHVATAKELSDKRTYGFRIPTWDHVPNGRLVIHSECYVWWRQDLRKRWSDGRTSRLEDELSHVLLGLVALGVALKQKADERQVEANRHAELERQRLERERQGRIAAARRRDIVERAAALDQANAVRRLIDAVQGQAAARDGNLDEDITAWLARAEEVADGLDPLTGGLKQLMADHDAAAEEAGRQPAPNSWRG